MIKLEGGKLTVGSSYSLKIPGSADYTSEEQGMWMGLEVSVPDDADLDKVLDDAFTLESKLTQDVKLAVYGQLDIEFHEVGEGILAPTYDRIVQSKAAPKPKTTPKGRRAQQAAKKTVKGRGSGAAGGGERKRKVEPEDIPTYMLVLDGEEEEVQDLRPIKEQGLYAENAADFRIVGTRQQYWLYEKDGSENDYAFEIADLIDSI